VLEEVEGGFADHFFTVYGYSPDVVLEMADQDDLRRLDDAKVGSLEVEVHSL